MVPSTREALPAPAARRFVISAPGVRRVTLGEDYASRLEAVADRIKRLGPDRRDPARFLEDKDGLEHDIRSMARQVEIDRVFGRSQAPRPAPPRLDCTPRLVTDRKGRTVRVEPRGRRRR